MTRPKRLLRVSDSEPGIRREWRDDDFVYLDPDGREIAEPDTLARIRSLAIPPAYTDVWICRQAQGHLQATGRDARGRKQYRYHPDWQRRQGERKFGHMLAFGRALPLIREQVARDIRLPGMPQAKILATVVRLLEATLIRVGNEGYVRANQSYGLTTLRDQHVSIQGAKLTFSFRGKHGIRHRISLRNPSLARIVQRSRNLPGSELFQYVDRRGMVHRVTSEDVNDYLRGCTGEDFTAKDFRTWAANTLYLGRMLEGGMATSASRAKRRLREALAEVAQRLGNTPAVCRKSYVHPRLLDASEDGSLFSWQAQFKDSQFEDREDSLRLHGMNQDEARLLAFLEDPGP